MQTDQQPTPPGLSEYLTVIRARRWSVIVVTLLVVVAALAFTSRQTRLYQAQAQVVANPITNPQNSAFLIQPTPNTEQQLVQSRVVVTAAQNEANRQNRLHGSDTSWAKFPFLTPTELKHLSVGVILNSSVLTISYTNSNPLIAARYANIFADSYVAYRNSQAQQQYQAALDAITNQITLVKASIVTDRNKIHDPTLDPKTSPAQVQADLDSLEAQLTVLIEQQQSIVANAAAAGTSAAQVVHYATVPTSPVSPKPVRNAALALIFGLALGVGVAFLRDRLDGRIKGRVDAEARLGAPVLAVVPRITSWRKREAVYMAMQADPRGQAAESYRILATTVRYLAANDGLHAVLMTSASPGEGKTTTVASLGIALAESGMRVILVSADLRKPRLHVFFGIDNAPGLSDHLLDGTEAASIIRDPGVRNLKVITSGRVPPNPAALLGTERMRKLISSLGHVADIVLIDSPPILAVADPMVLAPMVDGCLFIMDAGATDGDTMTRAREQFTVAGGRILGAIVNDVSSHGPNGYQYYGYYGRYGRYGTYASAEQAPAASNGELAGARSGRRSRRDPTGER